MAEEIELKLSAPVEVLAALRAHPALCAVAAGRWRTVRLSSVYYDTPARELCAAGVALRLRRNGARWLQTVKGEGDAVAGVHRRAEFEWPLTGARLDPGKLADTPWRKLFARTEGQYRRVFATEVRRSLLPLSFADGTRATLCFDVGEIRAGRRRRPLNEIEVEIEHGDALRLFELADRLATDLPLRVLHATKAQRGYALADGGAPEPRRAREVALAPDMTPQAALASVGFECVAQIGINAEAMLISEDPEYLHQLRVGWRRLRSLLQLARPLLAEAPDIEQDLRWLGSVLGPARDSDVFALETLPEVAAEFRAQRGLITLRGRATRHRRHLARVARDAVATPRFQRLLLALGSYLALLDRAPAPAEVPALARDWIGPVLQQRHDKLLRRSRHIGRILPAERHRARVASKNLRYAAEFFSSLFPGKRGAAYIVALSKLQSVLGRLNDLEVARKLLDELGPVEAGAAQSAYASGIVLGWLGARGAPALKRLRSAHRAFAKCEPFWTG